MSEKPNHNRSVRPWETTILSCAVKLNPDRSIERYKSRLVIKGFSQVKGVDFN